MNAKKHKISRQVRELLLTPSFILWCYNPTDETDREWADWQEKHPQRKADVLEARAILLKTKLNQIPFEAADSKQLYARIEAGVARKKQLRRQRRILLYSVAAACVACLLMTGTWWYAEKYAGENQIPAFADLVQIDSLQTEIELELISQEKLLLANKAAIKLNEEGALRIEDREVAAPAETVSPKDTAQVTTNTNMNVLKVPRGRHTVVHLSDGSKVWVNSETVLQFPAVFDKKHRTIYADGEIYLEVAKDQTRPFYVKTSQMNIRVLGTSFNVTAYKDDANQSVVLREGLVEVSTPGGEKRNMQPGNRLVLEGDRMDVTRVNTNYYTSWINGVLLFDGQDLRHIAQRLSRYYRMDFVCSPEVENYKGTGKLVLFDDINRVLHTLEEVFPVLSETNENTILLTPLKK